MNENNKEHIYMCIDLKSFYASVECVERGLDPLTTNLLVADESRTEKTICLAVTPSLKAYGLGGRCRLFEAVTKVREVNFERKRIAKIKEFSGKSYNDNELKNNLNLELDYIIAPPRMAKYIEYSTKIYNTYLKYVSREDIFVYSIDEVFIDVTKYLSFYKSSAVELAEKMVTDVFELTHITATCGIGTNMYLAKIAMDIVAKHTPPNENGARIAELDEMSYRKLLWAHKPLTDFWRIGPGINKKLISVGLFTMGDIARCSLKNEDLLYKLFGVNAELIIDHAWGYEPATMESVKAYKPLDRSVSVGQVLHAPYDYLKTKTIIKEMSDDLVLNLMNKNLYTNQIVITIGYDIDNLTNPEIRNKYQGEVVYDHYGRQIPKHAHGTINLDDYTYSTKEIANASLKLFDQIVDKNLLTRRINIVANHTIKKSNYVKKTNAYEQMNLFVNYEDEEKKKKEKEEQLFKEEKIEKAVLGIKNKYGKNAVLKAINLKEEGTQKNRNREIGGHKA